MAKKTAEPWIVLSRRSFLRAGAGLGAAALLGSCSDSKPPPPTKADPTGAPPPAPTPAPVPLPPAESLDDSPIERLPDGPADRQFFGDDWQRFHTALWTQEQAILERGGLPTDASTFEKVRLCIVGGGLSGLSCAYLLKDKNPLVLEGAVRLGGNAKGQIWGDLTYSIGSAYITNSAMDAEHMVMLKQLGLHKRWRKDDPTHDQMYIDGTIYPEFWFGGTDKARAKDFVATWNYFKHVREKAYPDIPVLPDSQVAGDAFKELDQRTFADEIKRGLGERLHPHVEDVVRQYCWSSFGADSSEISAAAGLNFLASDLGGMYVFPGGNSAISEALTQHIRKELGHGAIRSSQLVVDVRRAADGVRITYIGRDNKLYTVLAEACIVSTPKFVARKIVHDLPAAQIQAIQQLKYRSYLVANVLIDQPRPPDFHDLFCISSKSSAGAQADFNQRPFTDVVLATFAGSGHPSRTVLNLYRGMSYDTGRAELFAPDSYDRFRNLIEPALPVTLKALGLDPARIKDVRLTRWGHPMVIPSPGLISGGIPAAAAAPVHERIFFAQQDNFAIPAFETAFAAAAEARAHVNKVLG